MRGKILNNVLIWILLIGTIFTLSGCGSNEEKSSESTNLENYKGYWYVEKESTESTVGFGYDELEIKEINNNNTITFDYSIAELCGDKDIEVKIENNSGDFETEESKGTVKLDNDKILFKVKNVHYDTIFEKTFSYRSSESKKEVSKGNETTINNKTNTENNSYDKDAYVKKIEEIKNEYNDVDLKYGLVYIDEDDVPELIVDCEWYWQSIYKLENGKVVAISEYDGYGTHGSSGYSYIPKKNIIRRYATNNDGYSYEIYDQNLEMQYSVFCPLEGKLMYYKGNSEKEITSEKFDELSYKNQNPIDLKDEAKMNEKEIIDKLTK